MTRIRPSLEVPCVDESLAFYSSASSKCGSYVWRFIFNTFYELLSWPFISNFVQMSVTKRRWWSLVYVMAWYRQATSHYLNQCWPSSMVLLSLSDLYSLVILWSRNRCHVRICYRITIWSPIRDSILVRSHERQGVSNHRELDEFFSSGCSG